jgi:hypothetical protein
MRFFIALALLLVACQQQLPLDAVAVVNNELIEQRILQSPTYLSAINCLNETRVVSCNEQEQIERAIDRVLLLQDMQRRNAVPDTSPVEKDYAALVNSFGNNLPIMLEAENLTEYEFKAILIDTYKVNQYSYKLTENSSTPEQTLQAHVQRLRLQADIR